MINISLMYRVDTNVRLAEKKGPRWSSTEWKGANSAEKSLEQLEMKGRAKQPATPHQSSAFTSHQEEQTTGNNLRPPQVQKSFSSN